ncbi:MAG: inositol monophosphatase [Candidatus Rokubacteria bacterium]|nr:inositol monophosphatase [Candidatus Rokubacteria bacterium]
MASLERRVAVDAARAAGQLLHREHPRTRQVSYKGTVTNLVTEMDGRAETLVADALLKHFPDDGILGEEGGARAGRSGRRWIIDPLDGTTNYAHGLPIYSVGIGLERDGVVTLGVVYDPSRDELFVAERGAGAWMNDTRLAVSSTIELDRSLLATGFPYDIRTNPDNNLKEYATFAVRARAVRRLGSALLDLAYVAAGRLDGFWELTLGPWDVAAASVLLEEAGGRITDLRGGAVDIERPRVVASNGHIHESILAVLAEVRGA